MAAQGAVDAIFAAAREGNAGEVARLLDAQSDLLKVNGLLNGRSLLMEGARCGRAGVVRLLLEKGANVNSESRHGYTTALLWAVEGGHAEVVALLLRAGARRTKRRVGAGEGTWTALMAAACSGHVGVTRLFLQHMRDEGLDDRSGAGRTALWYACQCGHAEVFRALLLAGADHTISDRRGVTPRDQAAQPFQQGINPCARVFEWWDGELERGYALHLARRLHEDSTTQQQAPGAPVPAYLRQRVKLGAGLPIVELLSGEAVRSGEEEEDGPTEEEKGALLKYAIHDLAPELYIELLAGFHK